ncbi:MAG: S41 family peptidase, partial [Thermoleophilia bacterium]|jgi:carboxyl-terminal processing protease
MTRRLLKAVLAAFAVLAIFVAGMVVGGHPESTGLTQLREPVRGFFLGDSGQDLSAQVLRILRDEYYRDIDETALQERSVDALLEELDDPYTTYLDPDELAALDFHNDGAYVGVGLQVAARDEAVMITRVFPDSPAQEAGIRAGDRLVAVGGDAARGSELESVLGRIRGPEGSDVALTVRTPGAEPRTLDLTRSRIKVPAVEARIVRDGDRSVGYLRLLRFTRGASEALRVKAEQQLAAGVDGLVLDLREDPGGLVSEALGVAGVFLPEGSEVVTTEGRNSPRRTLRTDDEPVGEGVPLAVLVDRNSASSSEIVAGALRDGDRATLVGERTFGKALVQSTWLLRDGGALKLTTARYLTPSGFDLAERGLPPDVKAVDDPGTKTDEALDAALDQLETRGPAPDPAPVAP